MSAIQYYRRLAPGSLVLLAVLLPACGGSSSNQPPAADGPAGGAPVGPATPEPPGAAQQGTAHFSVDVASGQVTITPLGRAAASGDLASRAVYTGAAVTFNASQLVDQPGTSGIGVLSVSLTNRFGAPIGRNYLRVVISHLTPGNTATVDTRRQEQVAGAASGLTGVAAGDLTTEDGSRATSEPILVANASGRYGTADGGRPFFDYDLKTLGPGAPRASGAATLASGASTAAQAWWFDVPDRVRTFSFIATVEASTDGKASPEGTAGATNPRIHVQTVIKMAASAEAASLGQHDGPAELATVSRDNVGLAVAPDGAVYLTSGTTVRRYDPKSNKITTIAGATNVVGETAGSGVVATTARFASLSGIAAPLVDLLFVADFGKPRIYALQLQGGDAAQARNWAVSSIIGTGTSGAPDGSVTSPIRGPWGLAAASEHQIWFSDSESQICLATRGAEEASAPLNWRVQMVAGGGPGSTDNPPLFNLPYGLAVGHDGALYIADRHNHKIRRLTESSIVSTVAGAASGGTSPAGYVDGDAATARFNTLGDLVRDTAGYLYAVDEAGLRRVSPTGQVSTVVRRRSPATDGFGAAASVWWPARERLVALGVAPDGDIWLIDDAGLRRVSRVITSGTP